MQNPSRSILRTSLISTLLGLSAAATLAATPVARPNAVNAEIQARYEQERAKCLSGTSNQDRATCLQEAGAAREEALRRRLDTGDENLRRNERARCDALNGDERRDCLLRMRGAGTISGSAESGGIYRELHTLEIGPVPAAPAASKPPQ